MTDNEGQAFETIVSNKYIMHIHIYILYIYIYIYVRVCLFASNRGQPH